MTLIVAVTGSESIWLLADRRLSAQGRPPKDNGHKFMFLETTDGVAILGYAGLGATARGTQPADWMSAVLRGRNLSLEQSLEALTEAMQRELPPHLNHAPPEQIAAHHVFVPAFIGGESRLYTIDLVSSPDRKSYRYKYTRYVQQSSGLPPRLGIAGSGAFILLKDRRWRRRLLRVVKANECGNASARAVADYLAMLNRDVAAIDQLVGPRCIVAWRLRRGGFHKGGGSQGYYTGLERDRSSPALPAISRGTDMKALSEPLMSHMGPRVRAMLEGKAVPELDRDKINALLTCLPTEPDDVLR